MNEVGLQHVYLERTGSHALMQQLIWNICPIRFTLMRLCIIAVADQGGLVGSANGGYCLYPEFLTIEEGPIVNTEVRSSKWTSKQAFPYTESSAFLVISANYGRTRADRHRTDRRRASKLQPMTAFCLKSTRACLGQISSRAHPHLSHRHTSWEAGKLGSPGCDQIALSRISQMVGFGYLTLLTSYTEAGRCVADPVTCW